MIFNSTQTLTKIAEACNRGGYTQIAHTGDDTTTGRLLNLESKQTKEATITFTSSTAFDVHVDSVIDGTGIVGTTYNSTVLKFDTAGNFTTGDKFIIGCIAPQQILKSTAEELVIKLQRGASYTFVGFRFKPFIAGYFLRAYVMTEYDDTADLDHQATVAHASMPIPEDANIDCLIRNHGTAITMRVNVAVMDWLSVGYIDTVVNPANYALPLFAGGSCDDDAIQQYATLTRSAYFAATVPNCMQVRNPAGNWIKTATHTTIGGANIAIMPLRAIAASQFRHETDPDSIAEIDLVVAEGAGTGEGSRQVGIYGSLPDLYLGYMGLSTSQEFQTKTKNLQIGWSGADYVVDKVVLFDRGIQ